MASYDGNGKNERPVPGNSPSAPGVYRRKKPPTVERCMPNPGTHRGPSTESSRRKSATALDAIELLKQDHKVVADLFERYEASGEDRERKTLIAGRICQELTVHAALEEEIFYPKLRDALDGDDEGEHLLNEAESDHEEIANLVSELQQEIEGDGAGDSTDARVRELAEQVTHHVEEEEGELFPRVKKSDLDLDELGAEMATRKEELAEEV
jgi:hemerythrin superfamily protein